MIYIQLTKIERYQIKTLLKAGYTQKKIAIELDRDPSTIGREIKRIVGCGVIGLSKPIGWPRSANSRAVIP